MAAFDTPWTTLNEPMATSIDPSEAASSKVGNDPTPATMATFSPLQASSLSSTRSTVIIHQKSPLLVATPPQITRALAYSHPFLLPLNRLAGLLSWTTGDPWESFIFLCSFWATVLYGDVLILYAGPVLVIVGLMLGMYTRRFSPLSTYASPAAGTRDHRRTTSTVSISSESDGTTIRHNKSLDDIVDTLNQLTLRCNTLLDPFLKLTDFLSTQHTATSASTRPSLVRLLTRMLAVLPLWIALSLRPLHFITARRVVFVVGTLILTWHSKPARVCRTLLWRSLFVRKVSHLLTGLDFSLDEDALDLADGGAGAGAGGADRPRLAGRERSQRDLAQSMASGLGKAERVGVRFSFTLFENQRRWLGIGWTTTLFVYERAPWTDEHLNSAPSRDAFALPRVEGAGAAWRWVEGSDWRVEPIEVHSDGTAAAPSSSSSSTTTTNGPPAKAKEKFAPSSISIRGRGGADEGWIYYDNNWSGGRAQDGWGRYTRRRKWVRDAELVEIPTMEDAGKVGTAAAATTITTTAALIESPDGLSKRRGFFGRRVSKSSSKKSDRSGEKSGEDGEKSPQRLNDEGEDERSLQRQEWGVGDDLKMALG